MDTTRPLDGSGPSSRVTTTEPGSKPAARVDETAPVKSGGERKSTPATVAESVTISRQVLEAADAEAQRVDETKVAELKEQVRDGKFPLDAVEIVDRLLSDVAGGALVPPEGAE